jgi:hypothetical protein
LAAARTERMSRQTLSLVEAAIRRERKAASWRRSAQAISHYAEVLCNRQSPNASERMLWQARRPTSASSEQSDGATVQFEGALFFRSDRDKSVRGKIAIHGDVVLHEERAVLLSSTEVTSSGTCVSVRSGEYVVMRITFESKEEASRCVTALKEASTAFGEMSRKEATMRSSCSPISAVAGCLQSTYLSLTGGGRRTFAILRSTLTGELIAHIKPVESRTATDIWLEWTALSSQSHSEETTLALTEESSSTQGLLSVALCPLTAAAGCVQSTCSFLVGSGRRTFAILRSAARGDLIPHAKRSAQSSSATDLWLQWTSLSLQLHLEEKESFVGFSDVSLGCFPVLRTGNEATKLFLRLRQNLLILGSTADSFDDIYELSGTSSTSAGSIVSIYGREQIFLRILCTDTFVATALATALQAAVEAPISRRAVDATMALAPKKASSSSLLARLSRRRQTSPVSEVFDLSPGSVSATFEASVIFPDDPSNRITAKLQLVGDVVVIQSTEQKASRIQKTVVLHGKLIFNAGSMISVREGETLIFRMFLANETKAKACVSALQEASELLPALAKRFRTTHAPVIWQQLVAAARVTSAIPSNVFNSIRMAPVRCFSGIYSLLGQKTLLGIQRRDYTTSFSESCRYLRTGMDVVSTTRVTLLGDFLLFGSKWHVGEDCVEIANTTSKRVEDMIVVFSNDGSVLLRLWPLDGGEDTAKRLLRSIDEVVSRPSKIGSWERAERRRRIQAYVDGARRALKLRQRAEKLASWLFWNRGPHSSATDLYLRWKSNGSASTTSETQKHELLLRDVRFQSRSDSKNAAPTLRTLELLNDVLFISPSGPTFTLAGCSIFTNGNMVSLWKEEAFLCRMWFTLEQASRFIPLLNVATRLLAAQPVAAKAAVEVDFHSQMEAPNDFSPAVANSTEKELKEVNHAGSFVRQKTEERKLLSVVVPSNQEEKKEIKPPTVAAPKIFARSPTAPPTPRDHVWAESPSKARNRRYSKEPLNEPLPIPSTIIGG